VVEEKLAGKAEKNQLEDVARECKQRASSDELEKVKEKYKILDEKVQLCAMSSETQNIRNLLDVVQFELSQRVGVKDFCLQKDRLELLLEDFTSENRRRLDLHATLERQCRTLRAMVDLKPSYAEMPVTANLLKDTKHFKGICKGLFNTWMSWDEAFDGDWLAYLHRKDNPSNTAGIDVEARVQVIPIMPDSQERPEGTKLVKEGLGALTRFITDARWSADPEYFDGCGDSQSTPVCALVLDVKILDDASGNGQLYVACQRGTPTFTSNNPEAEFSTQVSVFVKVLAHSGATRLNLFKSRGSGVTVTGDAMGLGWRHFHSCEAKLTPYVSTIPASFDVNSAILRSSILTIFGSSFNTTTS
jgi:hypothetical protein